MYQRVQSLRAMRREPRTVPSAKRRIRLDSKLRPHKLDGEKLKKQNSLRRTRLLARGREACSVTFLKAGDAAGPPGPAS
jgi:hypothetical protein